MRSISGLSSSSSLGRIAEPQGLKPDNLYARTRPWKGRSSTAAQRVALFHAAAASACGSPTVCAETLLASSLQNGLRLLLHQFVRQRHGAHGVFGVTVGADLFRPTARDRRTSDH